MKVFRRKWTSGSHLYVMYLPALILFAVFVFYPLFEGVQISLTNWNGYSQHYQYVGLDNFKMLFTDHKVITAFQNTLVYGIGSTVIQNIWGLAYALLLNQVFFGRKLVRSAVYLPVLISGLVMGFIWYFIMQYDGGALNDIMLLFGMERVDWLADGSRGVKIILFATSMQFVGQSMIIYLAGLQTIPKTYYEAAEIDGTGAWRKFFNITLPLLMPAIIISVIYKLIGGLQLFDLIVALTGGGPGSSTHSFSTLINSLYFQSQNAGYATALGIVLFLFILCVTVITHKLISRNEVEH